jgi:cellulose biosynthesis protein BcsQ
MQVLGFWNNKGGTGKTSLSFQAICSFAKQNCDKKILVIDVCPQANLSELLLGGQENKGGKNLLTLHADTPRRSIGGYFQWRLPRPFESSGTAADDYISLPYSFNKKIPNNVFLLAGDPLLELQANAVSTLANTNIPGTDSWSAVVGWLIDLINTCTEQYDYCFIDMNPSFSMYTQIALACCQRLVLPVTADDSSRRGIQNALSLIYGVKLPSDIYMQHNFHSRMLKAKRNLPKIHLVAKNRLTQYIKTAKSYIAVLHGIDSDLKDLLLQHPEYFTFSNIVDGVIEIKDFQTAGVVAFARGTPFVSMKSGTLTLANQSVQVNKPQLDENRSIVSTMAGRLW